MKISQMLRQGGVVAGAGSKEFWVQAPKKVAFVAAVKDAQVKDAKSGTFEISGSVDFGAGASRYSKPFKKVAVRALKGLGVHVPKKHKDLPDPWLGILRVALDQGGAEEWLLSLSGE